ncbi:MAG: nitronate monooxygenase [Desulfobacterales bacterium]|nr:nitronate monooxygenase [Desulfobacterales bacterium]
MIKSRLCDLVGIKYPIIQAGMGPFSNNNLCVAAANAGVLGLLSTSGLFNKTDQPWIYEDFIKTAEATMDDDMATALEKVIKRTYRLVKDKGGIFGINVMVSVEARELCPSYDRYGHPAAGRKSRHEKQFQGHFYFRR